MKLYTEEEIKRLLKEQIIFDDEDFDKLTPIELPSDEEVEKESIDWWAPSPFSEGERLVIRQIKQQDK